MNNTDDNQTCYVTLNFSNVLSFFRHDEENVKLRGMLSCIQDIMLGKYIYKIIIATDINLKKPW